MRYILAKFSIYFPTFVNYEAVQQTPNILLHETETGNKLGLMPLPALRRPTAPTPLIFLSRSLSLSFSLTVSLTHTCSMCEYLRIFNPFSIYSTSQTRSPSVSSLVLPLTRSLREGERRERRSCESERVTLTVPLLSSLYLSLLPFLFNFFSISFPTPFNPSLSLSLSSLPPSLFSPPLSSLSLSTLPVPSLPPLYSPSLSPSHLSPSITPISFLLSHLFTLLPSLPLTCLPPSLLSAPSRWPAMETNDRLLSGDQGSWSA